MTLVDEVRAILGDGTLPSFRLAGEDLIVLSPDRLRPAAEAYERELAESIPVSLRGAVVREQGTILKQAHELVRRYNSGIHERIQGYVELARRVELEYPWPVVAILGILEVKRTLSRVHLFGWLGLSAERLGYRELTRAAERMDDVLRRTNRGIFAINELPDLAPRIQVGLLTWGTSSGSAVTATFDHVVVDPPYSTDLARSADTALPVRIGSDASPISAAVWPNPSSGVFNLELDGSGNGEVAVDILDEMARRVAHEQIDPATGNLVRFDLSNRPPGVYHIRLCEKDGSISVKRIVIIKD